MRGGTAPCFASGRGVERLDLGSLDVALVVKWSRAIGAVAVHDGWVYWEIRHEPGAKAGLHRIRVDGSSRDLFRFVVRDLSAVLPAQNTP